MHRILLLCFIHGFKGGDDTFNAFPEHLRQSIGRVLPNVTVKAITYPKYETRGDLKECVHRFREWLQNKIIDLEVAASTPSPTIDPSVHTILLGHSMGGIVAAETLLSIIDDSPIPPTTSSNPDPYPSVAAHTEPASTTSLLFPYIAGILAFDTPYLGIAPTVLAHVGESHYRSVNSAYSAFTSATSFFSSSSSPGSSAPAAGRNSKPSTPTSPTPPTPLSPPPQAIAAPPSSPTAGGAGSDAAATPAWQRWGKYAMFAGAAGAVAAGGAAAFLNRDKISQGWGWMGSHLEFVGCLARPEELKQRLERIGQTAEEKGIGFLDVVTVLGKGASAADGKGQGGEKEPMKFGPGGMVEVGGVRERGERTFCSLPVAGGSEETEGGSLIGGGNGRFFEKSRNDAAKDETEAHMSMFERGKNPAYHALVERARDVVASWVRDGEWYLSSECKGAEKQEGEEEEGVVEGDGEWEGRDERKSLGLIDVDLNDDGDTPGAHREDVGSPKGLGLGKEWVTGEEAVWVNK